MPSTAIEPDPRRQGRRRWRRVRRFRRLRRKDVLVLATDHHLDRLLARPRPGRERLDAATVAENGALVGKLLDLAHAMRNVEERDALRPQPLEHLEDRAHIRLAQRRGRLVENENARSASQRLGDLDHLLARQRQILHQHVGMTVGRAGAVQRFLGEPALRPGVDHPQAARRVGEQNVFGDREVRNQRELLEDTDDASVGGARRRGEPHLAIVEQHPALVRPDHPGHDLHQGRLSGAVLAEHGVDRAGAHREIGVVQRDRGAVALRDIFDAKDRAEAHHRRRPTQQERRGGAERPRAAAVTLWSGS